MSGAGDDLAVLARRAGLDIALRQHPADLAFAAAKAADIAAALATREPSSPESWPPLRLEPRHG